MSRSRKPRTITSHALGLPLVGTGDIGRSSRAIDHDAPELPLAGTRHENSRTAPRKDTDMNDSEVAAHTPSAMNNGMNKWHNGLLLASRPDALAGATYRIEDLVTGHAVYVTVNDIIRDGRRRPFEVFIETKDVEKHALAVALAAMASVVLRLGGDAALVVETLKGVPDPRGGNRMDGTQEPSLPAAIGTVIERHVARIKQGAERDTPPQANHTENYEEK